MLKNYIFSRYVNIKYVDGFLTWFLSILSIWQSSDKKSVKKLWNEKQYGLVVKCAALKNNHMANDWKPNLAWFAWT